MSNVAIMSRTSPGRAAQRGVVLFVGLVMLLLLSLIGVAAMQVTLLQERMAGNFKVQHDGFEAGETALSQGRNSARQQAAASGTIVFASPLRLVTNAGVANQFPWATWVTSETWPPAAANPIYSSADGAAIAAPRWSPTQGVALPPSGNALHYYSVAGIGADASQDARTALQAIYIF